MYKEISEVTINKTHLDDNRYDVLARGIESLVKNLSYSLDVNRISQLRDISIKIEKKEYWDGREFISLKAFLSGEEECCNE